MLPPSCSPSQTYRAMQADEHVRLLHDSHVHHQVFAEQMGPALNALPARACIIDTGSCGFMVHVQANVSLSDCDSSYTCGAHVEQT